MIEVLGSPFRAKRAFVLASALVFGVSMTLTTPVQAKSPVRQGEPCSKVGAQVEKGRWTFTCTKKSGKKVWVRKRTPKPAPAPAWQEVASQLAANAEGRRTSNAATNFEFFLSPTISTLAAEQAERAVETAYATWHAVAPLPADFPVYLVDAMSEDWYLGISAEYPNDTCGAYWWEKAISTPANNGGAVCGSPQHEWAYMVLFLGTRSAVSTWLSTHEAVHVAQGRLLGTGLFDMECWIGEGMAELYTGALAIPPPTSGPWLATQTYRNFVVGGLRALPTPSADLSNPAYWLDIIRQSENRGSELCRNFGLGYSLGYLVTERLVADFGESRVIEWLRESRRLGDSGIAFESTFSMAKDDWYQQSAAPYVASEVVAIIK